MRVLAIFISISSCFDLYALVTAKLGIYNLNALHIYTVVEYAFIAYFFSTIESLKKIKIGVLISIVLFSTGSLYHSFFIGDMFQFNYITRAIECLLLFLIGAYYPFELFVQDDYPSSLRNPYFWVSAAIIIYFGGNFVNFIFFQLITSIPTEGENLDFWYMHSVFNITANIFYFIAFICNPRQPK